MLIEKVMFLPRCNNPVAQISSSLQKSESLLNMKIDFYPGYWNNVFKKTAHDSLAGKLLGHKSFLGTNVAETNDHKEKQVPKCFRHSCFCFAFSALERRMFYYTHLQ